MGMGNMLDEVAKLHASIESASSQLAQQPAIGIFYINDHIQKSAPVVAQRAQSVLEQQHLCKLSKVQAEEAAATVKSLKTSGTAFCVTIHQQLDEAMLACSKLPTPPVGKTPASATAKSYVTKLPQLLSLSKLNLIRKST